MTTLEMLRDKLQEILGEQYFVCANDAFSRDFTGPMNTPYGARYDINHQAFEEYATKIGAVLSLTPLQLYNTPYRVEQMSYTLSFWVPLDVVKRDEKGVIIEPPPFDFYADAERLKSTLKGRVTVSDGTSQYKAFLTVSEPQLQSPVPERTGEHRRAVYQVNGVVSMSDTSFGTGDDITISIIDGETQRVIYNFSNLSSAGTVISFEVDDIQGESDPQVLEILNAYAFGRGRNSGYRRGIELIRIYKANRGIVLTDYAHLAVRYVVSGKSGFGKYYVTATLSDARPAADVYVYVPGAPEGQNYKYANVLTFEISSSTEGNAVFEQQNLNALQDVAIKSRSLAFDVEDTHDASDPALALLEKKAFQNSADLGLPSGKVRITLSRVGLSPIAFDAIMTVSYLQAETGYARYRVILTDTGSM